MSAQAKGRRVTLQDIARRTGYTANTVSRALKNKSDISEATCKHIQDVAEEMGYIRNQMASSLRSGQTRTLGLIVGGMSNPYYGIMADEIQNAAMAQGYSLLILCSRDETGIELRVAEAALSRQVDGILLFPSYGSTRTIQRIRALDVPFVLMGRPLDDETADVVSCDEAQGAYLMTRHLIEAGCRKLAYLCNYDVLYSTRARLEGYQRACTEAGLEDSFSRFSLLNDDDAILHQVLDWRQDGIDGLFLFCDEEAWRAINILTRHGLHIPGDIALGGFDNIQGTRPFPSPLCSVEYNMVRMAHKGVELLLRRIRGETMAPQHIVCEPTVVCRNSCGKKH